MKYDFRQEMWHCSCCSYQPKPIQRMFFCNSVIYIRETLKQALKDWCSYYLPVVCLRISLASAVIVTYATEAPENVGAKSLDSQTRSGDSAA